VLLIAATVNIAVFSWIINWQKLTGEPAEWFLIGLSRCLDAFGVKWGIILSGAAFGFVFSGIIFGY
jgi:hypothetical protein